MVEYRLFGKKLNVDMSLVYYFPVGYDQVLPLNVGSMAGSLAVLSFDGAINALKNMRKTLDDCVVCGHDKVMGVENTARLVKRFLLLANKK